MTEAEIYEIAAWLAKAGLKGLSETRVVAGFCERVIAAGLPLIRASVFIDTLHPVHEGRLFRWEADQAEVTSLEYGRTTDDEAGERWRRSPFYRLLESGESFLRRRITPQSEGEFSLFPELLAEGVTDYVAMINRFSEDGVIGDMDCVYSSWLSNRVEGFGDTDLAALRRLAPFLGLAVKSATLQQIAETLVQTYLGRDPGRRVLSGSIQRGVTEKIEAVLWFSDLRSFTRISDTSPPEHIIPFLNDYAEVIVSCINKDNGDVLKLIADGVLAIFPASERHHACDAALNAAKKAQAAIKELNARRSAEGLAVTDMYLGLHVGEVFYGNIGSKERLDFTVIGPAVNVVSRIAAMCRSVDQPILVSSAFAASVSHEARALVSVGRYALRGVGAPQELFTLDPEA
jgi:adenylate cyclase